MLRTLWGFVLAVFIFAATASAQSPLHYADDPWLILGEDTQLLQGPNGDDLSYRDFIISVLSVDILGKFLSELTSGQSLQAADVLAAGHVNVYLGLSAGEEYYDLLLDYNGDALITVEDFYGFLGDPRFDTTSFFGYAQERAQYWIPIVESAWSRLRNPWHNFTNALDVNRDGTINRLDRRTFIIVSHQIFGNMGYASGNSTELAHIEPIPNSAVDINNDGVLDMSDWRLLRAGLR